MSINAKSGFFNATKKSDGSYDRTYDASDFASYFSNFVSNGGVEIIRSSPCILFAF